MHSLVFMLICRLSKAIKINLFGSMSNGTLSNSNQNCDDCLSIDYLFHPIFIKRQPNGCNFLIVMIFLLVAAMPERSIFTWQHLCTYFQVKLDMTTPGNQVARNAKSLLMQDRGQPLAPRTPLELTLMSRFGSRVNFYLKPVFTSVK